MRGRAVLRVLCGLVDAEPSAQACLASPVENAGWLEQTEGGQGTTNASGTCMACSVWRFLDSDAGLAWRFCAKDITCMLCCVGMWPALGKSCWTALGRVKLARGTTPCEHQLQPCGLPLLPAG